METIAQFIGRLANKAGIASDDANLINVLSSAELSKINVPAELISGIDNNLLSLSQAKDNHPALKSLYHAQALNAFDTRMATILEESGLSPEKIAELKGERNTYTRFEQAIASIKESHAAALKSKPSAEDKTALQKQVDDLLNQIKSIKSDHTSEVERINTDRQKDKIGYEIKSMLSGVKTVFDDLPGTAKQAALDALIQKALSEKEASFTFDETGALTLRGKDDTTVVGANSTKYTPQSFFDEVLAQNKVLKVTDPVAPQTPQNGNQTTVVRGANPATSGINQTGVSANLAMLKQFEQATA